MARQKKSTRPTTNGDRVTNRDLMTAVQGVHARIDGVNRRVDESLDGQRAMSAQMVALHDAMHDLRKTTNDALHGMESRIKTLEFPWKLLGGGWRKAIVLAGGASTIVGLVMKFGVPVNWPF